MVNNNNTTTCYQIRDIDRSVWRDFTKRMPKGILDRNKEWIDLSIDTYLKILIAKLSKFSTEDLGNIVHPESKIKIEFPKEK